MRNTGGLGRKTAGAWLKQRRQALNVTQREIAKAIGLDYIAIISQIEAGDARVPAARYSDYARALKMDPKDFVRELLKHYDPEAWKILFGNAGSFITPASRPKCS